MRGCSPSTEYTHADAHTHKQTQCTWEAVTNIENAHTLLHTFHIHITTTYPDPSSAEWLCTAQCIPSFLPVRKRDNRSLFDEKELTSGPDM